MPRQLSIEWLRTLVLISEFGSIASAARRLERPAGSLRFHIRRLEEEIGAAVYRRSATGVELTEAGQLVLDYARRLTELHDDALASVLALEARGSLRVGLAEDIEAAIMPSLARFARLHTGLVLETRVDRSPALAQAVERGALDLALAFTAASGGTLVDVRPLAWLGADPEVARRRPVPLALLEAPCVFRDAALFSLDEARIPWRIAYTGPALSSLWTAVRAGLGVTVRMAAAAPPEIVTLDGLTPLPPLNLMMLAPPGDPPAPARRLRDWLLQRCAELPEFAASGRPA